MTGRVPRLWRKWYVLWAVFWLKAHRESMRVQLTHAQKRWSALPAHMDDIRSDIDLITVEIGDLEQELI